MTADQNKNVLDVADPRDELLIRCVAGKAVGQVAGFAVGGVEGFGEEVRLDQPFKGFRGGAWNVGNVFELREDICRC